MFSSVQSNSSRFIDDEIYIDYAKEQVPISDPHDENVLAEVRTKVSLLKRNVGRVVALNAVPKALTKEIRSVIPSDTHSATGYIVLVPNKKCSDIFNFFILLQTSPHIKNYIIDNNKRIVLTGCNKADVLKISNFFDTVDALTLGLDNVDRLTEMVSENKFGFSVSMDLKKHGKRFKFVISTKRSGLSGKEEMIQKLLLDFSKRLKQDSGFVVKLGSTYNVPGTRLTVYCDEIPDIRIFKLYSIFEYRVMLNEDLSICTDEEFEEVFSIFD